MEWHLLILKICLHGFWLQGPYFSCACNFPTYSNPTYHQLNWGNQTRKPKDPGLIPGMTQREAKADLPGSDGTCRFHWENFVQQRSQITTNWLWIIYLTRNEWKDPPVFPNRSLGQIVTEAPRCHWASARSALSGWASSDECFPLPSDCGELNWQHTNIELFMDIVNVFTFQR